MPSSSYLSPGVYVEEIDTGNKPIEGVSTSTTGLVGVTERGPANVPKLVTSFGEFRRVFGGYLRITDFTDPTGRAHCYLPHAVEGFFVNGGKRAYIVRVTAEEAARANRRLFFHDLAVASPDPTVLLRAAEEGTGTAINPPAIVVLAPTGLNASDVVRIGDGSRAEYRTIASVDATQRHVSVNLPLQRSHGTGVAVRDVARTVDTTGFTTGDFKLAADVEAGAAQILVSAGATPADLGALAALGAPELIEIGSGVTAEYVRATAFAPVGTTQVRLTLANPAQRDHSAGVTVTALEVSAGTDQVLQAAAHGGDSIVYLNELGGNYTNTAHLAVVDPGGADQEARRIGTLSALTLDLPPYEDYPISSLIEHVTVGDDDRNVTASSKTDATLDDVGAIEPGMAIVFDTGQAIVSGVDMTAKKVTFLVPLATAPTVATPAKVQPRKLTAEVAAGSVVLSLDARIGLSPGDVVRVGMAPDDEYVTVRQVSAPRSVPPDAGAIVIDGPLRRAHVNGADVHRQATALDTARQATFTLLDATTSAKQLLVADGTNYTTGEFVRVTLPSGDVHYHQIGSVTAATPGTIELDVALVRSHAAGNTVVVRQPLLEVRALDTGGWGNRVLVSVSPEEMGLLARADVTAATASPGPGIPSTLRLTTVTGVEAGTVLELRDPNNATVIGDFIKVKAIDRAANNLVILDSPGLSATHIAAFTAAGGVGERLVAHSKEFRLQVFLLGPPNLAVPIRNEDVIDQELFQQLSMDQRNSRYFERVIGSTFVDGGASDDLGQPLRRSDRRSEGGSAYVRVHDLASSGADRERVRLWPETLVDTLPSGLLRPARHRLGEGESLAIFGDDSVATMGDLMYQGQDDREPDRRTGIYALKNVESISLVAAPGQVTVPVQQGLIDHCEEMRYRFTVLDALGPDRDTLDDVQAQRQQFDTKYAAFYHPWLTIPDPFPTNLAAIGQFPIAPSGHVLGIYARTDDERGVHKAPANEIVTGLSGLTRYLNQREQDILNAYPVNIDVIRDFRSNNRGVRVWGARCITSDSDWKYVNVRRLLIFIEDSIDRGLQWVVFEPNSEELWARVRRAITNFLTTVWRNGALEGTAREQAFYVKCDRTTMTRDDIDNGRLIAIIGVAPVKPAEFVIIRIGLWTADASS